MPVIRPRRLVIALVTACLATGCALENPLSSTPATPTAAPSTAAASATPMTGVGLPAELPEVTLEQRYDDDPALPVSLSWPALAGATALNDGLTAWVDAAEKDFREGSSPSAVAPPELTVGWSIPYVGARLLGVQLDRFEFAGASTGEGSAALYGSRTGDRLWRSRDLLTPEATATVAQLTLAQLAAAGTPALLTATDLDGWDDALTTILPTVDGGLAVLYDRGAVAAASEGSLSVLLPAATAATLASEVGREVLSGGQVAPLPAASPSEEPIPSVTATPATQAAGSVNCAKAKCIALTFDDGPGAYTAALLDQLARDKASASFFVVGQNARVHPSLVARMAAEGHTVGNHTYTHPLLTRLSAAAQRTQIARTSRALVAAGAPTPTMLRPPYGAFNAATKTLGLALVNWNVDTEDWKNRNAAKTTQRALAGARRGAIILMHDIHASTVKAVPGIIRALKAKGYTLVNLDTLLGKTTAGRLYTSGR